jgi:uncharacterized protein YjbI with pentapeptide repeats
VRFSGAIEERDSRKVILSSAALERYSILGGAALQGSVLGGATLQGSILGGAALQRCDHIAFCRMALAAEVAL